MQLREIVLMTMITMTMGESGLGAADGFQCDEMGRAAAASLSQDDLKIDRKRKRSRGSKMAARLARVNEVEDQVLEKQAELLGWEKSVEEDVRVHVQLGKMLSFHTVSAHHRT